MKKQNQRLISFFAAGMMVMSGAAFKTAKATETKPVNSAITDYLKMYDKEAVKKSMNQVLQDLLKERVVKTKPIGDDVQSKEVKLNKEDIVRIIVELNEPSIAELKKTSESLTIASNNLSLKNEVVSKQEPLKNSIKNINPDCKFLNSFYVLTNAISLEAKVKDMDSIRELSGVKRVYIANEYSKDMNTAVDITKASTVWTSKKVKGEGVVVAIVDTGIDYTHKDMKVTDLSKTKIKKTDIVSSKGKFYTDKVPYGYNFADDNNEVIDKTKSMHGMHVAGIVGANASDSDVQANRGIKGVAPEVQLLAMKVFSNNPYFESAFSDNIAAAIEDSIVHGADVINMSLGSSGGFVNPEDIEQTAVKKASEAGIVCVISAGNSQYSTAPAKYPEVVDTGIVGSPGTSKESLMVASYENTKIIGAGLDYKSAKETGIMFYTANEEEPSVKDVLDAANGYEIVDCGVGKAKDFEGKSLTGKIALIKRGDISFVDKKLNAQAAGAKAAIIYNNKPGQIGGMVTDKAIKIPGISISDVDGVKLLELSKSGLKLTFKGTIVSTDNANTGDMSSFTSWGPTPNLSLRPYLSAPGGMIYSTVNNNSYESMSGTSMASPHAAGLTALVIENMKNIDSFKNLTGIEKVNVAKNILVNTAEPQLDKLTKNLLPFSPRRQGAGLANVDNALNNYVTATFAKNGEPVASLKDLQDNNKSIDFEIVLKNYGSKAVEYNIKDSYGVMTEQNLPYKATLSMSYDVTCNNAKVTLEKDKISVPAGGEVKVKATLNVDEKATKDIFMEGFIKFESTNKDNPSLGMPYLAFNGNWDKLKIIDSPAWDAKSFNKLTQLATSNKDGVFSLGITGKDINGKSIYDLNTIAINPDGENNNILPILSLLRNAKDLSVEIDDEKGNKIQSVITDSFITKAYQKRLEYINGMSAWNGTVFDKATGKYVSAPEGNYSVKVNANIDYENATTQSLVMPFKIDKTAPIISDFTVTEIKNGQYELKFKADEKGSGLKGVALIYDKENNYYDFDGQKVTKPELGKDGFYRLSVNLAPTSHILDLIVVDNAWNIGQQIQTISNLKITSPVLGYKTYSNSVDLKFQMDKNLLSSISGYEILVSDDEGKTISKIDDVDKMATSYRVKNMSQGKHVYLVHGIPSNSKVSEGYFAVTSVEVLGSKLNLAVSSPKPGQSFKSSDVITATGTTDIEPTKVTINDKDVTSTVKEVKVQAVDEETGLKVGPEKTSYSFSSVIEKETLVNGPNKVKVSVEYNDSFGNIADKQEYAIDFNYELKSAELTITNPMNKVVNTYTDYVSLDAKEYIIKGEALSYLSGYDVFVNGENILDVQVEGKIDEKKNKTKKSFEKAIALTDKVTNAEVKLVSKTGEVISYMLAIKKLDYASYGVSFDTANNTTVTSANYNIMGTYNLTRKDITIKCNNEAVNLVPTSDRFIIPVKLIEGENLIKIEVSVPGEKVALVKEYKVKYEKPITTKPTLNILDIKQASSGDYGIIIPRDANKATIKINAGDLNYGHTIIVKEYDLSMNIKTIKQIRSDVVGVKDYTLELTADKDFLIYRIMVVNDKNISSYKMVTVAKQDIFKSKYALTISQNLADGMLVNSSKFRINGNAGSQLAVFKINDKDVKLSPQATFDEIVKLNEGANTVKIQLALKPVSVAEKVVVDTYEVKVNCDTVAPAITVNNLKNDVLQVPFDTKEFTVSGSLKDLLPCALTLNGKDVKLNDKNQFNISVILEDGENEVYLLAQDSVGNMSEKMIKVVRTPIDSNTLNGVKVNGKGLAGFISDKYDYNVIVDSIENKIPTIEPVLPEATNYKVSIIPAKTIPGATVVEVTAADGTSKISYKINFIRAFEVTLVSPANKTLAYGKTEIVYNAKNNLPQSKEVTLIAALYDNGRFVTWTSVKQVIKSGDSSEIKVAFDVPLYLNKPSVRCFAVDSNENMRLLSDPVEVTLK